MRDDESEFWFLHRLQVSNVRVLDIKAQPTPDGKGLELTFPISAGVRLNL